MHRNTSNSQQVAGNGVFNKNVVPCFTTNSNFWKLAGIIQGPCVWRKIGAEAIWQSWWIWRGKCYTLLPVSLEKIAGINPVSEIYYTLEQLRRASYLWWWFDGRWCAVNHQGCHNSKNKYFVGVISGFRLSPLTEKCRLSYADTQLLSNMSKKPGLFPPINEPSHLFCLWTRPCDKSMEKNTSYKLCSFGVKRVSFTCLCQTKESHFEELVKRHVQKIRHNLHLEFLVLNDFCVIQTLHLQMLGKI